MKSKLAHTLLGAVAVGIFITCCQMNMPPDFLTENIEHADRQYRHLVNNLPQQDPVLFPHTQNGDGEHRYAQVGHDWTVGFFPGNLWHLYALTGKEYWKLTAEKYTQLLEQVQYDTLQQDIGFIIGCSYLNGYRLTGKKEYVPVVIQAAQTLATRFRPNLGVFESYPSNRLGRKRGNSLTAKEEGIDRNLCAVVIGSMMDLEILFEATRLSGDSTYYTMACSHAKQTLKNHVRENGSIHQVVGYHPSTGKVEHQGSKQSQDDELSWARGQAWALYGCAVCYRYTQDSSYLRLVEKLYNYVFTNPKLPEDLIPFWNLDALNISREPRDVSAAAIMASALYELHALTRNEIYKLTADRLMETLASPAYRADIGENLGFLLMHSVGNKPDGWTIDKPLVYADYYFLEALKHKSKIE